MALRHVMFACPRQWTNVYALTCVIHLLHFCSGSAVVGSPSWAAIICSTLLTSGQGPKLISSSGLDRFLHAAQFKKVCVLQCYRAEGDPLLLQLSSGGS
jgi:hypothetical protein